MRNKWFVISFCPSSWRTILNTDEIIIKFENLEWEIINSVHAIFQRCWWSPNWLHDLFTVSYKFSFHCIDYFCKITLSKIHRLFNSLIYIHIYQAMNSHYIIRICIVLMSSGFQICELLKHIYYSWNII